MNEDITWLAPSQRAAIEERGGWRTAVTWKDGFGRMRVCVENGPSSHAMARRALRARFGEEWSAGYVPSLRTVATTPLIREYQEV